MSDIPIFCPPTLKYIIYLNAWKSQKVHLKLCQTSKKYFLFYSLDIIHTISFKNDQIKIWPTEILTNFTTQKKLAKREKFVIRNSLHLFGSQIVISQFVNWHIFDHTIKHLIIENQKLTLNEFEYLASNVEYLIIYKSLITVKEEEARLHQILPQTPFLKYFTW